MSNLMQMFLDGGRPSIWFFYVSCSPDILQSLKGLYLILCTQLPVRGKAGGSQEKDFYGPVLEMVHIIHYPEVSPMAPPAQWQRRLENIVYFCVQEEEKRKIINVQQSMPQRWKNSVSISMNRFNAAKMQYIIYVA